MLALKKVNSNAFRKGWAKHFPKPQVDGGIVLKCLSDNDHLVKDLGTYESLSRSSAVCPQGLVANMSLLRALVRVEKQLRFQPNLSEQLWCRC